MLLGNGVSRLKNAGINFNVIKSLSLPSISLSQCLPAKQVTNSSVSRQHRTKSQLVPFKPYLYIQNVGLAVSWKDFWEMSLRLMPANLHQQQPLLATTVHTFAHADATQSSAIFVIFLLTEPRSLVQKRSSSGLADGELCSSFTR